MPSYDYECEDCGKVCERNHGMDFAAICVLCDVCDGPTVRLISSTSFQLRGDGWASDGYSKDAGGV
ncbi:MAG: FmdB family zinc ribbon protein [Dehalococcoidales bacterium]